MIGIRLRDRAISKANSNASLFIALGPAAPISVDGKTCPGPSNCGEIKQNKNLINKKSLEIMHQKFHHDKDTIDAWGGSIGSTDLVSLKIVICASNLLVGHIAETTLIAQPCREFKHG